MKRVCAVTCSAILWAACVAAAAAAAESDALLLTSAERAFELGGRPDTSAAERIAAFSDAAKFYRTLIHDRGIRNGDIYCNWARAEFLAGNPARCVAALREGLMLWPGDTRLRESLEAVRARIDWPTDGKIAPPPMPLVWVRGDTLTVILGLSWLAAWLLLLVLWPKRRIFAVFTASCCLILSVAAITMIVLTWSAQRRDRVHPPIVVAHETAFRRGNGDSYPSHPDAPRLVVGMEARLLYRRGGWIQIEFATGQVGWIPIENAIVVGDRGPSQAARESRLRIGGADAPG